ncbi:esterase B1-like [Chironomus tepperi]|uniref:esterase B1-like n=1 Tax=Chironomus tepperi TaxID=113505 RepID=UPI00391F938A
MTITMVHTQYGSIEGSIRTSKLDKEFLSFQGIPFMKQPIKELRFRDPQPPEPWTIPIDCTKDCSSYCNFIGLKSGKEDAAGINVFVRIDAIKKDRLLPVFVYIHGGGFFSGSSRHDLCGPDYMVERDIVLVTFNYRLGVLGFLSLNDPSLNIPGNAGLKDQVFALKWIQQNIKAFGGDPNNVTLCGESAGAVSIHLHMISEQSHGLFHKAILISGSAFIKSWGVIDKSDFAERLARRCGWDGNGGEAKMLEILEKANPHTLMKFGDVTNLFTEDEFSQFMIFGFQPVVEPYVGKNCFLPKDPVLLAQEGVWSTDIPCLIGGATIEGAMFSFLHRNQKSIDLLQKPQYFCPSKELNIDLNSPKALKYGQMLKELYFADKPVTMKNLEILLDYAGDRQIWHGVYNAIKQRIKAGGKTFMFRFDANTKMNLIKQIGKIEYTGAAHGDMSLYFLSSSYVEAPKPNSIEYKMMEKMIKLIESFLLTRNPNTEAENVVWEPVTDEFNCLTINEKNFEIGVFPEKDVLDVWNSIFEEENVKVY